VEHKSVEREARTAPARALRNASGQGRHKASANAARFANARWFGGLAIALATAWSGPAQPVRVTSWNMQAGPERSLEETALTLGKLSPDVILLQQVRDWQLCEQLIEALRPAAYSVAICSAFRDAQGNFSKEGQVAILSKRKAYFSWSEAWATQAGSGGRGGFAFAAIQVGRQRAGFFSVQLDPLSGKAGGRARNSAPPALPVEWNQQWQAEFEEVKNWTTNRIEAVVVGGGFSTSSSGSAAERMQEKALGRVFLGAQIDQPLIMPERSELSQNYILARLAPNSERLPGVILDGSPANCDLDLNLQVPLPAATYVQGTASLHGEQRGGQSDAAASARVGDMATRWAWGAGLLVIAAGGCVWAFGKRRWAVGAKASAMAGAGQGEAVVPSSEAVVINARSVTATGGGTADRAEPQPAIRVQTAGITQTQSGLWRERALAAEQRAKRANALVRSGLIPLVSQWLREKLVRRLLKDRTELLETQQEAVVKAMVVDERLARLELQIQRQNQVYERRIEELTVELNAAKEGNRELIRAQIAQVKAEMELARAKARAQARAADPG